MNFVIQRHVSSTKARKLVPKRFASHLGDRDFAAGESVLLIFPHSHNEVVLSSHARRALARLSELGEPIRVAIGHNFTREASQLLASSGFRLVAERDWVWTDDSYKSVTDAAS
jgi:hypothetical protein